MAFPSFNTLAAVEAQVAALVKQYSSPSVVVPTAAYWPPLCVAALQRATNRIYERLISRGYTPTQIAGWDSAADVELVLASVFALTDAGMLESTDAKLLERYDFLLKPKEGLLDTVLLTVGQQWQSPADSPGTVGSGNPSPGPCSQRHWSPDDYDTRF